MILLLLEMFLRCVPTLCVTLCIVHNSLVHSNSVINKLRDRDTLFRTGLRDGLKNFSSNNSAVLVE